MSERRSFRTLLRAGGCTPALGAGDPLTARIAARAGFEAIYIGGNAIGLAQAKGQPFVTLSDTVDATVRVARVVDAALVVDAGAGFGGMSHVAAAVRELEAAGAGALHIDDQPYPKSPDYHRGRGAVAPIAEWAQRLRVAKMSLRSPDTMLVARTDALRVTKSLEEVIARGRAAREAGADALLPLDLGPAQAVAVSAALPGLPLIWIGGVQPPVPTLAALGEAGFVAALYPFNAVAAACAAVSDLAAELQRSGVVAQDDALLARMRKETLDIVDMAAAWAIEDGADD